jgi:hypothetical protein
MPSQERGRLHQPSPPDRARQEPRKPGQHRAVGPVKPGSGHLPAEHRDLVPQHQQLRVLGRRAPRQQRKPSQQLAEAQIEQSSRHPPIIWISVSLGEPAARSVRLTFWHPHASPLAAVGGHIILHTALTLRGTEMPPYATGGAHIVPLGHRRPVTKTAGLAERR